MMMLVRMMMRLINNFHKIRPDMLSPPQDASTGGPHFKMYDTLWDNSYSSGEVALKIESGGKTQKDSVTTWVAGAGQSMVNHEETSQPNLSSFLFNSLLVVQHPAKKTIELRASEVHRK